MPILQLVILALVQGITEFLPISSSAHLILAPEVVDGWDDQGRAIDVAAHVGSLFAVMAYFRAETGQLFAGGVDTLRNRDTSDRRLFLLLAGATIPLIVFGGALAISGLSDHMRDPRVIATTSIVFGIALWVADRKPVQLSGMPDKWKPAMAIGAAQALAAIPGTSRSGVTMTAARWLGYSREDAARFSMLLAIPAILFSGGYETLGMIKEGAGAPVGDALIVAVLSFFAAWATIAVFMRLTRRMSFTPFVLYRIALGVVLFAIFN